MKLMLTIFVAAMSILVEISTQATSIDLALPDKYDYCTVVAEMTIESIWTTHDNSLMLDELTCKGRVIRPLKGCQSNDIVSLRFHLLNTNAVYLNRTFLVFAFAQNGQLRPFGAQEGLIEKGREYEDLFLDADVVRHRTLNYSDLLSELERKRKANQALQPMAHP